MPTESYSPAYQLIKLVWDKAQEVTPHSWYRLNRCLYKATHLAIDAGMRFDPEDFAALASNFRMSYWGGKDDTGYGESFYRSAVLNGNRSAAISFERWTVREPYRVNKFEYPSYNHHHTGSRHRDGRTRIAVGARFVWKGHSVIVTSFRDGYVVACSYENDDYNCKVKKIFKITREELLLEHPAPKKRKVDDADAD